MAIDSVTQTLESTTTQQRSPIDAHHKPPSMRFAYTNKSANFSTEQWLRSLHKSPNLVA